MRPNPRQLRTATPRVALLGVGAALLTSGLGCGSRGESPSGVNDEYEIVVERIGRIGERDGDGMIIGTVQFTFLDDGRIALTDLGDPGRVKLFLSDGTFLGAFGRLGQGPAEFQRPDHQYLVPSGDTLVVLDYALGRKTRWAADGSEHYDTRLFPTAMGALFLENGRVVLNEPYINPTGAPLPLKLVDRDGAVVRAFGTPYAMNAPLEARPAQRHLSRGSDGTIWEVPLFEYRLTQWDTAGNLLRVIRGDHIEMPLAGEIPDVFPDSPRDPPPSSSVGGLGWDGGEGVLWALIQEPHPDWPTRLASWENRRNPSIDERYGNRGLRRTRLEAWDPEQGVLVASKALEERWRLPMGPGLGLSYSSSPEGFLFLDVWRARLERRRK